MCGAGGLGSPPKDVTGKEVAPASESTPRARLGGAPGGHRGLRGSGGERPLEVAGERHGELPAPGARRKAEPAPCPAGREGEKERGCGARRRPRQKPPRRSPSRRSPCAGRGAAWSSPGAAQRAAPRDEAPLTAADPPAAPMAKERSRKALAELLQRPGNAACADCAAPGKRGRGLRHPLLPVGPSSLPRTPAGTGWGSRLRRGRPRRRCRTAVPSRRVPPAPLRRSAVLSCHRAAAAAASVREDRWPRSDLRPALPCADSARRFSAGLPRWEPGCAGVGTAPGTAPRPLEPRAPWGSAARPRLSLGAACLVQRGCPGGVLDDRIGTDALPHPIFFFLITAWEHRNVRELTWL